MTTGSARQDIEVKAIVDKAIKTWEWHIGTDMNPGLLDREDIDEAYEEVRSAIRDDLDRITARGGSLGYSENHLLGTYFPHLWTSMSSRGIFLDFEGDHLVPALSRHLRPRLFKADQEARRRYDVWVRKQKEDRYDKRVAKQENQVVWNREIFESMTDLATDFLLADGATSEKGLLARKTIAISWFTGRRPWSEAALRADFIESDGPDWADGWLMVKGLAKQVTAVKEGLEEEAAIPIPLFGITADDFLEGFHRFRAMEKGIEWIQPTNPKGYQLVKEKLDYACKKELKSSVTRAFAPTFEAGYTPKLEMKSFRALYASQGHHAQQEWCLANGQAPSNINGYAKRYIGHQGMGSEQDTAEYLRWTYIDDRPIPSID